MPVSDAPVSDSFTDAANTRLDCHIPEVGSGWCCLENTHSAPASDYLKVAAGGTTLVASDGESSQRYVYGTREFMTTPDVRVRITATTVPAGGGDDPFWLLARVRNHQNLYGAGSYDGGAQKIYKKVAGVSTQIATLAGAIVNGDYFEFYLIGSRLELHKNGVLVLAVSDSALSGAGRAGFAAGNIFISTDDTNTGYAWDDYSVNLLRHLVRADSFTDAAGTNLISHYPDKGDMWVMGLQNYYNVYLQVTGNYIVTNISYVGGTLVYVLDPELSGCEYAVEFSIPGVSAGVSPICLVARFTNGLNYYAGGTYRGSVANDKAIYKCVAGVYTLIAQADSGLSAGDTLRLEVENGAQRLYHNNVLVVSGADTALTEAGAVGIGVGGALTGAGDTSAGWNIDDFKDWLFGGPLTRDEGGIATAVRTVTAAADTVNSRDYFLVCNTASNAIAETLPPANQQKGRELIVKNIGGGANDVTLTPVGTDTVDYATVADGDSRIIRSDGVSAWYTVAEA